MKWADINWSKREYYVNVAKTHQSATLPISNLFYDVLVEQSVFWGHRERVFPRWSNPDSVTHLVKQALIKGGYPGLHLHNLRHSFASCFVESGGNIFTLSKLLTHSNVNTTQIYAHLTQGHLAAEVDRVRL
jgi:integrase